jgi:hypothetical protein
VVYKFFVTKITKKRLKMENIKLLGLEMAKGV